MQHTILAEPAETQGLRHDHATIALHWTTAVLVVALWLIGQTIDWAPRGAWRVDYRSVHIVLGLALGVVLIARLLWRLSRKDTLGPIAEGLMLLLARLTHWTLYVLLILAVGLGIGTAWAGGESIFNLFNIPALAPGNNSLVRMIRGWHSLAANAILIVAGVHAAAALFHHYILRDATLRRMLPWAIR
jgi:cytochrome b561